MADRLGIGGVGSGKLARLEPLIGGLFQLSGTGQVMGQKLRPPIDQIRKMLLQGGGNSPMQFLAAAAQQRAVGGVLQSYRSWFALPAGRASSRYLFVQARSGAPKASRRPKQQKLALGHKSFPRR